MLFSHFISCLINWWVYAATFLDLCPSHSLYSAKLSTTKSWREIETEKKTQQRKLMSKYVKLKWLNLQNDRSFFCCLLQLSLSWMFERTEQRPTSSSNPTQAHNLSISAFSHSARLPIKSADHYRHGDRRLGVIKQAFRTAGYQKVTHWRKEFTSLLKLTWHSIESRSRDILVLKWYDSLSLLVYLGLSQTEQIFPISEASGLEQRDAQNVFTGLATVFFLPPWLFPH